jgi:PRTRC genetic system protein E
MFQQLVPLLRQRSVLLTVTLLEEDQVRVNVMPKKLADSENTALTTPMSFTGTAEELDTQLPSALVSYVASHLDLKHTLEKAKEEMAAAAKAVQEEARNKSKSIKKTSDSVTKAKPIEEREAEKKEEAKAPAAASLPGLFDVPGASPAVDPAPSGPAPSATDIDEENELLAEISEAEHNDGDADEPA